MIGRPRLDEASRRRHHVSGAWRNETMYDYVVHAAAADPGKIAVVDASGHLTYGQTVEQTGRAMSALSGLGVRSGDVVALQLPTVAAFVPAFLAAERLGAIVCPLIPNLPEHTLRSILSQAEPRVVISIGHDGNAEPASTVTRIRGTQSALGHTEVAVIDADVPVACHSWPHLLAHADNAFMPPPPPHADDLAELAFTSGTTGEPKGALHTHNTSLSGVRSTIVRQRIVSDDVVHVALPVGHNFGYVYGVRLALTAGATLVLQRRWDPLEMMALVARHDVTVSSGTPTHLVDLLEHRPQWQGQLDSLRLFTCAGAKLAAYDAERALKHFPARLSRAFGMTEIGHVAATGPDSPAEKAVTTEGSAQPEVGLRVITDSGATAAPEEQGELAVEGPFVFAGYLDPNSTSSPTLTGDQWFRTGDIGYLDSDGYLVLTGRTKEVIVRGGEKIPIVQVEGLLRGHADIVDVAVVGVPDARLGERAVACIKTSGAAAPSLSDIQAFLDSRGLGRLFWPEACLTVDEVPRTATGKVLRGKLADDVANAARLQWEVNKGGA